MKKDYSSRKSLANQSKRYALLAALGVLGILIVFLIIYLLSMFLKAQKPGLPVMQTTAEESTSGEDEDSTNDIPEGRAVMLFYIYEPKGSLEYVWLIDANLSDRLISISAISPDTTALVGTDNQKLKTHFENGKTLQLSQAIESLSGKKIDRYIGFEHKDFVKAIRAFGSADIYVEFDISYNTDEVNLQLKEGMQRLDFNTLPNYLKYISDVKKDIRLQSELMCSMIYSYMNESNIQKGEALFESLINLSKSDINAYDYFNSKSVLENIQKGKIDIISENLVTD